MRESGILAFEWCGDGAGPGEAGQVVVLVQDAVLQVAQLRSGLQSEFLDEEVAGCGVDRQRVGPPVLALKPGATIDRATVVEHCVSRLAKFKIPSDITIVDALPRNATGKVLKRELRTQFVGAEAPKIS